MRPVDALAPVNMLWVRGDLPWYAQMSIRSFVHHGHEVRLHTYEPPSAVPDGCVVEDARATLPESTVFGLRPDARNNLGGYLSGFSDWFRYELLHARGGWWVDTDVICQRPFVGRSEYMFGSGATAQRRYVNGNVIYADRPGTEFFAWCAAFARECGDDIAHAETGPLLLDRVLRERGMFGFVVHPRLFNPIEYRDVGLLLKRRPALELIALTRKLRRLRPVYLRGSWCLHLFWSMAREHPALRSPETIPRDSFVARIIARNTGLAHFGGGRTG